MKIVAASETPVTANMVRGVFLQRKLAGIDVVHANSRDALTAAGGDASVILVDWESEPARGVDFVLAAREANQKAPILLLCPKIKAGTTFAGIKAGAAGVINKPIDPDDLIRSVANAVKRSQAVRPTVNVEFINPFIDATRNVFSSMCRVEIARKKIFLKEDYKTLGDISGVMELSGAASGTVAVGMPAGLACLVVGNMLGEPPAAELTRDVKDATGEIINMIAGQAKASLVKTKYHFTISIPQVVDAGHEMAHQSGAPNIVVLFEGAGFDFALQVCLVPNDEIQV